MTTNNQKPAFRLLILIATPKLSKKAIELYKQENVPVQYFVHAQGTASSEIMDMLGLDGIDKNVLMCMVPRFFAAWSAFHPRKSGAPYTSGRFCRSRPAPAYP